MRLEIGRVSRMGIDEELDGFARRGDDLARGEFLCSGVGHGGVFVVGDAALVEGNAAGGARGPGGFGIGGRRAKHFVGSVKRLERRIRGVFGRPFG